MATIIQSSNVFTDTQISHSRNGPITLHPHGYNIGPLPTLYDHHGKFIAVANSWFFDLKTVKRLKCLNSSARAILCYWSFLEESQLTWDNIPPIDRLKPTYQFRHYLLLKVQDGNMAYSTANCYMNHVVQFYLWAIYETYLVVQEEKKAPFRIEYTTINRQDKLAHLKPKLIVQTSDLRIRVPKHAHSSQVRTLLPLSRESLQLVSNHLRYQSVEFQLQCRLAIQTGLRINEVCSLTLTAIDQAFPITDSRQRYYLPIGPSNGVKTKFDKERKIEISSSLLKMLQDYSISERRLKRQIKMDNKLSVTDRLTIPLTHTTQHPPLFISEQGNPLTAKVLGVRWCEFRKVLQKSEPGFHHKFHDLRSTYGTYRLGDLLTSGLNSSEALDCLMGWMGHNHESTTWKYIRYLKRKEALRDKFSMLDTLMHDALTADSEAHNE
ncbi:integrase [Vibrio anguillarum]|uniref:site-specific integrase n=1 Tax=Vibrio anguillarum TaxID=55601 RepID=UPI000B53E335|nr:site-specific integrase [Vibrio anguillarum]ASG08610.1 integrase [Vibrio anguillarum]ASG09021.1 integrase [Vibrio anguillarum]